MRSPDSSNLRGDCFGMISIYFADSDHGNKLFSGDSLKRTVWGGNRSIKTISGTFLDHFICNVNYLPWPRPLAALQGVDKFQFVHAASNTLKVSLRSTASSPRFF